MDKKIWTSLGSDPEFFLYDHNKCAPISSLGIIPGDKQSPHNLTPLGEGYTIQKDNVLVEFCVPPVINMNGLSIEEASLIFNAIRKAINYTKQHILPKGVDIIHLSSMEYPEDQLDNDYARTFGCSSSINAWTTEIFDVKNDPNNKYRGAGFHLHIGYSNPDIRSTLQLVKLLDICVGVPNLRNPSEASTNRYRRKTYGRAGDFRITSYGFEYRVLGAGAAPDEESFYNILAGINKAFKLFNEGFEISNKLAIDTQICINTCKKSLISGITEGII